MNKLKKNLRTMIELLIKQSKVDVLVVVQIYFYACVLMSSLSRLTRINTTLTNALVKTGE